MNPMIRRKLSRLRKLTLLNVMIWMLFATLAFGSSMIIDLGRKCFGEYYRAQLSTIQNAIDRVMISGFGVGITKNIGIAAEEENKNEAARSAQQDAASLSLAQKTVPDKNTVRTLQILSDITPAGLMHKKTGSSKGKIGTEEIVVVDGEKNYAGLSPEGKDREIKVIEDPYYALENKEEAKDETSPADMAEVEQGSDKPSESTAQPVTGAPVSVQQGTGGGSTGLGSIVTGGTTTTVQDYNFNVVGFSDNTDEASAKLLYLTQDGGRTYVYEMLPDGMGVTNLFSSPDMLSGAAWSNDGKKIFYVKNGQLCETGTDGAGEVLLTSVSAGTAERPAISPKTGEIAFALQKGNASDIYIRDLPSGAIRQVTTGDRKYTRPSWAPDGNNLLAIGEESSRKLIFSVDPKTGTATKLSSSTGNVSSAMLSPDGAKIIFASDLYGDSDIFLLDTDTGILEILTYAKSSETDPAWSPDGNSIAFISDRDGKRDVYTIGVDGTNITKILKTRSGALSLSWLWDTGGNGIPPSKITNLAAAPTDGISVTLSWTAPGKDGSSGTASSYDVRYSTEEITEENWNEAREAKNEPLPAAAGTSQTFRVGPLLSSSTYYFAVKTKGATLCDISSISNVVRASTLSSSDITLTLPPASVSAMAIEGLKIELKWTLSPSDDVVGYIIYQSVGNGNGTAIGVVDAYTSQYVVKNLSDAKRYEFFIKSYDERVNYSGPSALVSAVAFVYRTMPPRSFSVNNETEEYIELKWELGDYRSNKMIRIYRKALSNAEYIKIAELGTDKRSYRDYSAEKEKASYYVATTVSDTGEESYYSYEVYGINGLAKIGRVLVIANSNSAGSTEVAEYYKLARGIPDANIIRLPISNTDEISAAGYANEIERPLKDYLLNTRDNSGLLLEDTVLFIVTTYGVPYICDEGGDIDSVDAKIEGIFGEYPEPFDGNFTSDKGGYIVSRIDGSSAETAKGLIDRTLYAEEYANFTSGRAYFDRFGAGGTYQGITDASNNSVYYNMQTVRVEDIYADLNDNTDFKAADCADAIFYYGWQDGYTREVFDWKIGGVGCAIGSSKKLDLRSDTTWLGGALNENITAAVGLVKDVSGEDPFSRFMGAFLSGRNFAESSRIASQSKNLITIGDPLYNIAYATPPEPREEGPRFINISAVMDVASTSMIFDWETDVPSCGRVEWGEDVLYSFTNVGREVFEDAEDGLTGGWIVYDNFPEGASVTNVDDNEKNSKVIKLSGDGMNNSYRFRKADYSDLDYRGSFLLGLELKVDTAMPPEKQDFTILVSCDTTDGLRYLEYTTEDTDRLGEFTYVTHGLTSGIMDGQWHKVTRDLARDLHESQPNVDIRDVNFIFVKGSLCVDNIAFYKQDGAMKKTHRDNVPVASMGFDVYNSPQFHYRIAARGPEGIDSFSGDHTFLIMLGSISGAVTVQGITDYSGEVVTIQLRRPGDNRSLQGYLNPSNDTNSRKDDIQVTLDAGGNYMLYGVLPGVYDVTLKAPNSLMGVKKNVVVGFGEDITGLNFGPLFTGDATGNNVVDNRDEQMLIDLINSGNYDVNADFNRDGVVDEKDLAILRANLDTIGEGGELELRPEIEQINDVSVNERDAVEFIIKAYDANSDKITFAVENLPEGAVFTDNGNGTASFSWIPGWWQGKSVGQVEDYNVMFTASDGEMTSYPEDVTISVLDTNDPIRLEGFTEEISAAEGAESAMSVQAYGYRGRAINCQLDISQLTEAQQDEMQNATVTTAGPYGSGNDVYYNFTFKWKPGFKAAGDYYPIIFTFNDGTEPVVKSANITVSNVPSPPSVPVGLSLMKRFNYNDDENTVASTSRRIAAYGNYVIVAPDESQFTAANGKCASIKIFDVTNPRKPVYKMDYVDIPEGQPYGEFCSQLYDMKLVEDKLYMYRVLYVPSDQNWSDYFSYNELRILDISDIESGNISLYASYREMPAVTAAYEKVVINSSIAFISAENGRIFKMLDVRDTQNIRIIYSEDYGEDSTNYKIIKDAFVKDGKAYAAFGDKGFDVYDILNPDGVLKLKTLYGVFDASNNLSLKEAILPTDNVGKINSVCVQSGYTDSTGAYYDYLYVFAKNTTLYYGKYPETLQLYRLYDFSKIIFKFRYANTVDSVDYTKIMFTDDVAYVAAQGADPLNHRIVTFDTARVRTYSIASAIAYNDQLKVSTETSRPYSDMFYDKNRCLLFALREYGTGYDCISFDVIRTGMKRATPTSITGAFYFLENENFELSALIEDPDEEPGPITAWMENSLPPAVTAIVEGTLQYEFDGRNTLTVRGTMVACPSASTYVNGVNKICADDGRHTPPDSEKKQSVPIRSVNKKFILQ